jgi:la-related protein 1
MAPHLYYFAMPTSDGLQALPFVPPPPTPPAMLISPLEQLQRELLVQIEYYFRYLFVYICGRHYGDH